MYSSWSNERSVKTTLNQSINQSIKLVVTKLPVHKSISQRVSHSNIHTETNVVALSYRFIYSSEIIHAQYVTVRAVCSNIRSDPPTT